MARQITKNEAFLAMDFLVFCTLLELKDKGWTANEAMSAEKEIEEYVKERFRAFCDCEEIDGIIA